MLRTRLLILLVSLAAMLTVAGPAQAASSISLDAAADWSNAGATVDVSGTATCSGGTGTVVVQLRQGSVLGHGTNPNVVCDGSPHSFAVTVTAPVGGLFQLGAVRATATLTAPSGNASTSRTVQLQ
jgi:hypothetical protein